MQDQGCGCQKVRRSQRILAPCEIAPAGRPTLAARGELKVETHPLGVLACVDLPATLLFSAPSCRILSFSSHCAPELQAPHICPLRAVHSLPAHLDRTFHPRRPHIARTYSFNHHVGRQEDRRLQRRHALLQDLEGALTHHAPCAQECTITYGEPNGCRPRILRIFNPHDSHEQIRLVWGRLQPQLLPAMCAGTQRQCHCEKLGLTVYSLLSASQLFPSAKRPALLPTGTSTPMKRRSVCTLDSRRNIS